MARLTLAERVAKHAVGKALAVPARGKQNTAPQAIRISLPARKYTFTLALYGSDATGEHKVRRTF